MRRLTRAAVRELDRRATDEFHIPDILLMEHAAQAVCAEALQLRSEIASARPILIIIGGGNNGGDGLAVARLLHLRNVAVEVALAIDPARLRAAALTNWKIVEAIRLPFVTIFPGWKIEAEKYAVIIDALFGTGLEQPPRANAVAIIEAMNAASTPILSIDVPSGLDADTGLPLGPSCVHADRTVTFVAEKAGFAHAGSTAYTGQVIVSDIGLPRQLRPA